MKKYKENSKNNFNRQAKIYDNSICSMYPRKCYDSVINEIKQIKYKKLLDVGCGTGEILNKIATNKNDYYGLDLSENMLKIAKTKSNSKNITYMYGDSENLNFKDNMFDIVICTESFHHYPNPENVAKEFYRVLKPNGTLILCDMYRKEPLRSFYNILMRVVNTGDVKIYTKKEIIKIFSITNFKLIKYYFSTKQTYLAIFKKRSSSNE